ncbi:MAG: hypothetical protein J6O50_11455 [Ruminiclostridium sp.]|nr:hypothetical protein [Ruminiclostridium sp.]
MELLNKIKINFDGENQALVIQYSDVVLSINLSSEGRLHINTSCLIKKTDPPTPLTTH